jgi:hypothetical protein
MSNRIFFKPYDCNMSDEEWEEHCIELERQERIRRMYAVLLDEIVNGPVE